MTLSKKELAAYVFTNIIQTRMLNTTEQVTINIKHKRMDYIDNLKGLLIVLVVLGHCIQNFLPNYEGNIVFRFIYSFHMPFFFFVSGFVSYKDHIGWKSIWRRFKQLMIPFFAWAIIKALILQDFHILPHIIVHPDNGLWFLYALFFISLFMKVCDSIASLKHFNRAVVIIAMSGFLLSLMNLVNLRTFGFDAIASYFLFYAAGFLAKQFDLFKKYSLVVAFIFTVLFLCIEPFWRFNELPSFLPVGINPLFGSAFRLVVPFIAILGLFPLAKRFMDGHSLIGSYLGSRTLGVYAIHPALINLVLVLCPNINWGGGNSCIICSFSPFSYIINLRIVLKK